LDFCRPEDRRELVHRRAVEDVSPFNANDLPRRRRVNVSWSYPSQGSGGIVGPCIAIPWIAIPWIAIIISHKRFMVEILLPY
jgi:hypothetical protein